MDEQLIKKIKEDIQLYENPGDVQLSLRISIPGTLSQALTFIAERMRMEPSLLTALVVNGMVKERFESYLKQAISQVQVEPQATKSIADIQSLINGVSTGDMNNKLKSLQEMMSSLQSMAQQVEQLKKVTGETDADASGDKK